MTVAAAPTVRDLVREIQVEIRETSPVPARACELLGTLAALSGNCAEAVRVADAEYAEVLLDHLASSEPGSRALKRLQAETTASYQRKREARDTRELVRELMQSLKLRLRVAEAERFAR